MLNAAYSNILRRSANRWGVEVPDGPLDDADIPLANVVEVFKWQGARPWQHAQIDLVTLNGLWSFTMNFSDNGIGGGFGPFLKFCDPVPTRSDALALAIASFLKNKRDLSPDLLAWLIRLQPQQLSLF